MQYLYLLFDEENPLHSDDSNYVLTTEGHIMYLPREYLKPMSESRRRMRREENNQCPAYVPVYAAYDWQSGSGLIQGIRSRTDIDYARYLTGMAPEKADEYLASPDGWCETPQMDVFVRTAFHNAWIQNSWFCEFSRTTLSCRRMAATR